MPKDLAVNAQLPNPGLLHPKIRALLGPVYEQFEHSHWREGFNVAVRVVESEARRYLVQGISTGRITVLDEAGSPRNPTQAQIKKK